MKFNKVPLDLGQYFISTHPKVLGVASWRARSQTTRLELLATHVELECGRDLAYSKPRFLGR